MDFVKPQSKSEMINDVSAELHDDELILRWKWPQNVSYVLIYKTTAHDKVSPDKITEHNSKLYTREEYINENGYHEKIMAINLFTYAVFSYLRIEGKTMLVDQEEADNQITIATGRSNVYYSINTKRRLFSRRKAVQMVIRTEMNINKDVLCYVIKEGGHPVNREDGRIYPFAQNFRAGRNVLPDIDINANEYIKIFFTDGKRYGEIYNLIKG